MRLSKIIVIAALLQTILSAKCEDAVSYTVFLKEITKYEKQIKLLENKIELLSIKNKQLSSKKAQKKTSFSVPSKKKEGYFKVTATVADVFHKANGESRKVYRLIRNERVEIDGCDKYKWCKIKNKRLFIREKNIRVAN